ncbi:MULTISPECIES: sodium:solute symporter family protein [Clostridium]|jgi:SSS family solute:Na+ symporter|uniref:sodium:solute symporter family protein n=1 Tax=Clostridium TaxID=1485 RepID=UPI0015FD46EF|nr:MULTISPECIES: sodium:solute symporter family protein [Clostridium]MCC2171637.1 sodium:solute symporter family protein [Clostridium fessum]
MTFMELKTAPHLLIFVIVYFGVMIGIGAWASKKIKSSEDYALAGRSLGPFVLMGTLLATSVGSGTITGGGNSLAYNYGYWAGIQWVIPFIVFCIIYMCVYKQIRKSNCFTVPQILQQKYGAETRILGSVINLFGMAGIIASQYKGFGYVLNITTGIDPKTSTVIATIIIIILSVTGGLFSVAWTDAVSAFLIVACCIVGVPFVLKAGGGWESITATAAAIDPNKLSFFGGRNIIIWIGSFLPLILLETGDQNFYTRLTAAKTDKTARNAIIGWGVMALIVMPCVGIIAFTGSVLFGTNIDAGMSFLSTTTIIPAFIGGMLLAASTAFIITTGTSYLLTCGTSVTYDFYKQYINKTPDDSQTLWVNRIGTALIGIIALIILNFFPTILALQNWSYTMIGASITPAVLGSMFSKKVTRPAGFLSMLCGAIATLTWELLGCPGGYQSALIAAPISILVLVIVSAFTQKTLAGEAA